jgi:uncharacterized protein (TIGR03546 family)
LGLVPKGNLFAVIFLLFFFLFNVNKGMALISAALFTPVGYLIDGPAHDIGSALLLSPALAGLWTWLYNLPVVPWTKFNNTVVLGNLVVGLVLFAPLYIGFKRFVFYYRARWKPKVDRLPLVRAVQGLHIVQTYKSWTEE